MELRWDLSVLIFIEYLDWLEALKILRPTMSCSMNSLSVFSSFVSIAELLAAGPGDFVAIESDGLGPVLAALLIGIESCLVICLLPW